ncbi:MAG: hypothetical protein CBB68_15050 [Rhodospirillaceae bacterium TMED8]|nr:hypothetical protein [Magnetovibrio sp.]OUT47746.1 MAG: hypothetical protein CBB68_15050 [Rhodospirillaceae bacterium TMED8]
MPENKAWLTYVTWCLGRGLEAVPTHPWTLAAYVRWCEPGMTIKMIMKTIKEISQAHETKTRKRLDHNPLVLRTLQIIERRRESKKIQPRADLFELSPNAPEKKITPPKKKKIAIAAGTHPAPRRGMSTAPKLVSRRKLSR